MMIKNQEYLGSLVVESPSPNPVSDAAQPLNPPECSRDHLFAGLWLLCSALCTSSNCHFYFLLLHPADAFFSKSRFYSPVGPTEHPIPPHSQLPCPFKSTYILLISIYFFPMSCSYMQNTCDVAEKAILAKKKLRK